MYRFALLSAQCTLDKEQVCCESIITSPHKHKVLIYFQGHQAFTLGSVFKEKSMSKQRCIVYSLWKAKKSLQTFCVGVKETPISQRCFTLNRLDDKWKDCRGNSHGKYISLIICGIIGGCILFMFWTAVTWHICAF